MEICYGTSKKKYREKLNKVKFNNVPINLENWKYYVVFNIKTKISVFLTYGVVEVDLARTTLATIGNGLKIANLDVAREEHGIKKYQKRLS